MKKRFLIILSLTLALATGGFAQASLISQLKESEPQINKDVYKTMKIWYNKKTARKYKNYLIIYYLEMKNLEMESYLQASSKEFIPINNWISKKLKECPTLENFEIFTYGLEKKELAYQTYIYDDSLNLFGQGYQKFPYILYKRTEEYEENEKLFKYLLKLNAEVYFVIPEKPFVYYAWLNNRIHKIQYDSKTESVIENIIEKE